MTAAERLSGAESAGRIARYLDNPCGFGTCAGHIDCQDKHCPEHPCKTGLLGLPVIDPKFFDEQIKRSDLQIQCAEEETTGLLNNIKRDAAFWLKYGAAAICGGLLVALVIYASTKGAL